MIERRTQQSPFVLLIVLSAVLSSSTALLTSRQQQHRSFLGKHDVALSMVAKSGGKLIKDETEFAEDVLASETTKPVMVFFTAPWYDFFWWAVTSFLLFSNLGYGVSLSHLLRLINLSFSLNNNYYRCGPCRLSVPVVKDVMKEYAGQMTVVEVCTDDLPEVASDAGVVSIPTIQMYCQGELQDTIVGCVARNVLASSVEKVLEESPGALVEDDGFEDL